MNQYLTSKRADADIKEIYIYTAKRFDLIQADKYLARLYTQFSVLGANPNIGKPITHTPGNYRCFEYESHIIFYKKRKKDVFVVRVLHKNMDFKRHL
jgi:toxin ParE1/3/4